MKRNGAWRWTGFDCAGWETCFPGFKRHHTYSCNDRSHVSLAAPLNLRMRRGRQKMALKYHWSWWIFIEWIGKGSFFSPNSLRDLDADAVGLFRLGSTQEDRPWTPFNFNNIDSNLQITLGFRLPLLNFFKKALTLVIQRYKVRSEIVLIKRRTKCSKMFPLCCAALLKNKHLYHVYHPKPFWKYHNNSRLSSMRVQYRPNGPSWTETDRYGSKFPRLIVIKTEDEESTSCLKEILLYIQSRVRLKDNRQLRDAQSRIVRRIWLCYTYFIAIFRARYTLKRDKACCWLANDIGSVFPSWRANLWLRLG